MLRTFQFQLLATTILYAPSIAALEATCDSLCEMKVEKLVGGKILTRIEKELVSVCPPTISDALGRKSKEPWAPALFSIEDKVTRDGAGEVALQEQEEKRIKICTQQLRSNKEKK